MRKAQGMNFKDLSLDVLLWSLSGTAIQTTLLSSSDQLNMQQASEIVENFPLKMSIYYSATIATRSWSLIKKIIQERITYYH